MKKLLMPHIIGNLQNLHEIGVYCIYHISKPNLFYVGSASSKFRITGTKCKAGFYYRWINHYHSFIRKNHFSKYLQNTINKYGIEGVRFQILEICDENKCLEVEDLWIKYLDCFKNGYNCSPSSAIFKGRTHTEETKKKMGDTWRKLNEKRRVPIAKYNLNGEFLRTYPSIISAEFPNLTCICYKYAEVFRAYDFLWLRLEDLKDYPLTVPSIPNKKFRKVSKYSMNGEFIETFESIKEAIKTINGTHDGIKKNLSGIRKTYKGFVWKREY